MSLSTYIKETRVELKHVNWPSRRQTITYTIVVITFSLIIALLLGAFDVIFHYLLKLFI